MAAACSQVPVPVSAEKRRPLVVVVPAFNEGQSIGAVVSELRAAGHGVVVVDDGSLDDTAAAALATGATVLRHPINRGQGAAIQTGLTHGVATGATFVATFDADGQHRVEDLARMVAALEQSGADVALGSRFLGEAVDMPASRRILLKLAILLTWLTEGVHLTDAHNGLRVFTAAAASRIDIHHDGMAHASEVIEQIRLLGLKWIEVPTTVRYTAYSRAKGQRAVGSLGIVVELLTGKLR